LDYETVIGMEVHVELETASKMFCRCSAKHFLVEANRHICPVCTAQPGSLPVINERAMELTVITGMALNCQIQSRNIFARKNYVYPDLPKGYQISQYEDPLCTDGSIGITVDGIEKEIGIVRVHLEEDTGKLVHEVGASLVDYNRAGVPLMEIVSDSSLRSAEEAYAYLIKIRQIVRYLGASSGDMEKGAMRCEANISVRPEGSSAYGTKVEVKNLNSFRSVRNAITYETERQIRVLEGGGQVSQVTAGWDENAGVTREQRSKETSEDYRYFPEPDLLRVELESAWIERLRSAMPELPAAKAARFSADYGLGDQEMEVLVDDHRVADYFEEVLQHDGAEPKQVSNWVAGEVFRRLNEDDVEIRSIQLTPPMLAELIALVSKGTINQSGAKEVFALLWENGGSPATIVRERGLEQVSDSGELEGVVATVIGENPDVVEKIKAGNDKAINALMGQVMKATRGKASPAVVTDLLKKQLGV
jgi:aspartyl-tRNA(Asn)/glutamyl-tRNA(Gln) amidotransferase subunit B